MLKFASDLSDDYEYGIVSWGQSNANPRGTLTEGFDAAPHLEFEDSGADLTVSVVGSSSTVACAAGVGADQWVGAELRMGNASAQSTGYGTVTDCTAASSKVVTFPTNDKATWVAHGLLTGCPVLFAGVAPPTGITLGTIYYVRVDTADTFVLHPTHADAIANTSAVSITANSGTGPFVGYAGSTLTVTWTDTPSTAADTAAHVCFRDDRHKAYQEVRVLTPYLPDQAGAYPSGTPAMPGYTVAATITHENLAAFLPLTFKEGVASFGQCETDEVAASATSSSLTLDSAVLLASGYAGGYVRVRHAGGTSWGNVTDNTDTVFTVDAWAGAGTPSGTASAWTWEAWLPHGSNNPYHLLPGPGFLYPNNAQQPIGAVRNVPRNNTTAAYGDKFGALIAFAWRLAQKVGKRINVIHLAGNASSIMRSLSLFGGPTTVGWWSTATHLDWSTSNTDNLAGRLKNLITVAAPAALVAEGNTKPLRILGCLGFEGEAEAGNDVGRDLYETLLPGFYGWLRGIIAGAGMNPYAATAKIPVVHASLPAYPWGADGVDTEDVVNEAIARFVAVDGFAATFDTDDSPHIGTPPTYLDGDPLHFNGEGEAINGELAANAMGTLIALAIGHNVDAGAVDICNIALSHIGENGRITSLDTDVDESAEAAICARYYPIARNTVLEHGSWTFTSRRKTLVSVTNTRTEWQYAYAIPSDVLSIISILPPDAPDDYLATVAVDQYRSIATDNEFFQINAPAKFTTEIDDEGNRVLYTNMADAEMRYNAIVSDTRQYPPTFRMALSWHLASLLAGAIIKGDVGAKQAQLCSQTAQAYIRKSGAVDGQQRKVDPRPKAGWLGL